MKIPVKYQFGAIWIGLLVLLFGMFGLSHFDLKAIGTGGILGMAALQAVLVLAFFMRLRNSSKLVRLTACVGFFWLLLLFVLAFSDYLTRQWH